MHGVYSKKRILAIAVFDDSQLWGSPGWGLRT